jgi:hypothetical protein
LFVFNCFVSEREHKRLESNNNNNTNAVATAEKKESSVKLYRQLHSNNTDDVPQDYLCPISQVQ